MEPTNNRLILLFVGVMGACSHKGIRVKKKQPV